MVISATSRLSSRVTSVTVGTIPSPSLPSSTRPFGTALVYEDKLYIQTGKIKNVSKQIAKNPKVELCAFMDGKWLRLSGKLVNDERREVKKAMLDKMPVLRGMYSEDDDNTQVLYFEDAEAVFSSFGQESKTYHF